MSMRWSLSNHIQKDTHNEVQVVQKTCNPLFSFSLLARNEWDKVELVDEHVGMAVHTLWGRPSIGHVT